MNNSHDIRRPARYDQQKSEKGVAKVIRTQVAVVGAGPAGLTVANLLRRDNIDCIVLENQSRSFVESHPRAGFIEEWAVRSLQRHGLADRLLRAAQTHTRFELRFAGARHEFPYSSLVGDRHFVYPQQNLVTDLLASHADHGGGRVVFGVQDIRLHDLDTSPSVTYLDPEAGTTQRIECDFVAGCDGAHGVCRRYFPENSTLRHDYGVGSLAILAEAPPSADNVVFGIHPRGFAGHMARSPQVTRFYLQCAPDDVEGNWPDERVWAELHTRLSVPGHDINEGPLIEKRVLSLHNYVVEPMSLGRLHLAGDAAHLIAPVAAKGMNLALHDAFLLAGAITAHYHGDGGKLAGYSAACLARVWQYQEFTHWLSEIFHGSTSNDEGETFRSRLAQARLRRILGSPTAAHAFAEMYLGVQADFC